MSAFVPRCECCGCGCVAARAQLSRCERHLQARVDFDDLVDGWLTKLGDADTLAELIGNRAKGNSFFMAALRSELGEADDEDEVDPAEAAGVPMRDTSLDHDLPF